MPSIFVWKAEHLISTTDTIQYFMGSNWYMEEYSNRTRSVQYRNQYTLSNHVIVWDAVCMPESWVGSYLLDTVTIPYCLIKEDAYATLEQLGIWLRCTVHDPISFEPFELEEVYRNIQAWRDMEPIERIRTVGLPSLPLQVTHTANNVPHMRTEYSRTKRPMYRV
jgi:hypothetical protein